MHPVICDAWSHLDFTSPDHASKLCDNEASKHAILEGTGKQGQDIKPSPLCPCCPVASWIVDPLTCRSLMKFARGEGMFYAEKNM